MNFQRQNDRYIRRYEVFWEGNINPQLWFSLFTLRWVAAIGEVVKRDVPSSFHGPTMVIGSRDPDEESLGVFGITKELPGFTMWCKFGEIIGQDTRRTGHPEKVKVRQVQFVSVPKLERGFVWGK